MKVYLVRWLSDAYPWTAQPPWWSGDPQWVTEPSPEATALPPPDGPRADPRSWCWRSDPRLLKAFADREAAEEYCRDLHRGRGTPREANPFRTFANWRSQLQTIDTYGPQYGKLPSLADITGFDEPILHDWLLDCGLTPPEPIAVRATKKREAFTIRDWDAWWQATAPHLDDLQRARVWQVCDRARTFEVLEVEMEA
jgi:hypothetical protein